MSRYLTRKCKAEGCYKLAGYDQSRKLWLCHEHVRLANEIEKRTKRILALIAVLLILSCSKSFPPDLV